MTPLQLQMMLHYYAVAAPYAEDNPLHANSEAVSNQRNELAQLGLIRAVSSASGYEATERGKTYVRALCSMPLPTCRWVIPTETFAAAMSYHSISSAAPR